MEQETHDQRAAKVAEAARDYAKAARQGRPLKTVQDDLLEAVGSLIGADAVTAIVTGSGRGGVKPS